MDRRACIFVAAVFLAVIMAPGLIQTVSELRHGEQPRVLDVFLQPPTARNLHAYEQSLEETSLVVKQLRPWMQYLEWRFLADAGEKAVVGRDGWLFYRPSVRYVIERQTGVPESDSADPLAAIRSFRDQLQARESGCWSFRCPTRRASIPRCSPSGQKTRESSSANRRVVCSISWSKDGIEYVDLFEVFRRARQDGEPVGFEAALPGAGQPLVAGGCTAGRRRCRAASARWQAPSIGVITLTSSVRSPSGATAIWLRCCRCRRSSARSNRRAWRACKWSSQTAERRTAMRRSPRS